MKFKTMFLFLTLILFLNVGIVSAETAKNTVSVKDASISISYYDDMKKEQVAAVKGSLMGVNASPFVTRDSLNDLTFKTDVFVYLITYQRYSGYILFSFGEGQKKVKMWINKKNYIVLNSDWEAIKYGNLKEAPSFSNGAAYIPLEVFNLGGYTYSVNKNQVNINLTKKSTEFPVITKYDRETETVVIKKDGKEDNYKLIGVNFPDDDKVFNKYSKSYFDSLIGKKVNIKYDSSDGAITYNKNKNYYYAYVYLVGESKSINEDILYNGYTYYYDYNVGSELTDGLENAALRAKSNQMGVYHEKDMYELNENIDEMNDGDLRQEDELESNQFKVVEAIEKTQYDEEHGLGQTVVTERKIILDHNGQVIKVDFLDPNVPYLLQEYGSLAIKTAKEKLIGKVITLRITPEDNYEYVLFLLDYMKSMK